MLRAVFAEGKKSAYSIPLLFSVLLMAFFSISSSAFAACTATPMGYGDTHNGTIDDTDCETSPRGAGYYAEYATFIGATGEWVEATADWQWPNIDGYLYLTDDNDVVLAQNEDYGGIEHSQVVFELPGSGTFRVWVTSSSAGEEGDFSLSLATADFRNHSSILTGRDVNDVDFADLDGDGDQDMITLYYNDDRMGIRMNNGDMTFAVETLYVTGTGPESVAAGDFNHDGDIDLVVADWAQDRVSVFNNTGNGTFDPKFDYGVGDGPISVQTAYFNGDSYMDFAVLNSNANSIWAMVYNPLTSQFEVLDAVTTGSNPRELAVGDVMDHDGADYPDLVATDYGGSTISIFKLSRVWNGSEWVYEFGPRISIPADYPHGVAIGDLDGDGHDDIAVGVGNDPSTGATDMSVFINDGNDGFETAVSYNVGKDPEGIALFDADNDGDKDAVVANQDDDAVSYLKNNGDGTFAGQKVYWLCGLDCQDYGPTQVGFADLDGDGDTDFAVPHMYGWGMDEEVVIFENLLPAGSGGGAEGGPIRTVADSTMSDMGM